MKTLHKIWEIEREVCWGLNCKHLQHSRNNSNNFIQNFQHAFIEVIQIFYALSIHFRSVCSTKDSWKISDFLYVINDSCLIFENKYFLCPISRSFSVARACVTEKFILSGTYFWLKYSEYTVKSGYLECKQHLLPLSIFGMCWLKSFRLFTLLRMMFSFFGWELFFTRHLDSNWKRFS